MPKDHYLFDLTPRRALLCDGVQLIIARITSNAAGKTLYQGCGYVREGRASLLRDLRRRDIAPTPDALEKINATVPTASDINRLGWQTAYGQLIAAHADTVPA